MIDINKYLADDSGYFSGINIVPFTDVVLVLLIIFMIAAPGLVKSGMDIRLPGAKSGKSAIETRLTLGLQKDGKLYLNGELLPKKLLKERLMQKMAGQKNISIILNADKAAPHGSVVAILDLIRIVGIKKIYVGAINN